MTKTKKRLIWIIGIVVILAILVTLFFLWHYFTNRVDDPTLMYPTEEERAEFHSVFNDDPEYQALQQEYLDAKGTNKEYSKFHKLELYVRRNPPDTYVAPDSTPFSELHYSDEGGSGATLISFPMWVDIDPETGEVLFNSYEYWTEEKIEETQINQKIREYVDKEYEELKKSVQELP